MWCTYFIIESRACSNVDSQGGMGQILFSSELSKEIKANASLMHHAFSRTHFRTTTRFGVPYSPGPLLFLVTDDDFPVIRHSVHHRSCIPSWSARLSRSNSYYLSITSLLTPLQITERRYLMSIFTPRSPPRKPLFTIGWIYLGNPWHLQHRKWCREDHHSQCKSRKFIQVFFRTYSFFKAIVRPDQCVFKIKNNHY